MLLERVVCASVLVVIRCVLWVLGLVALISRVVRAAVVVSFAHWTRFDACASLQPIQLVEDSLAHRVDGDNKTVGNVRVKERNEM